MRRQALLPLLLPLFACGTPATRFTDAGTDGGFDAGSVDAGADAGFDAGVVDAGTDGGIDAGFSDGGTDGGSQASHHVSGVAQKGPFQAGATVTLQQLDDQLNPTGQTFSVETTDNSGSFAIPPAVSSNLIEVIINGFFFDEVWLTAQPTAATFRAYADISAAQTNATVNVNLLTHLQGERLAALLDGGASFSDAEAQSREEVLAAFHIPPQYGSDFTQADLTAGTDESAIMMAVSVVMLEAGYSGSTSTAEADALELVDQFRLSMQSGAPSDAIEAKIAAVETNFQCSTMTAAIQSLAGYYGTYGIPFTAPPAMDFIDTGWTGTINRLNDAGVDCCPGVDTQSDPSNCGGCGNVCLGAEGCFDGGCSCGSNTICGTSCVDTSSDSNNCGGCAGDGGVICPGAEACVDGGCDCTSGTFCGGNCVDTTSDTNNCGGCAGDGGVVCPGAEACIDGGCSCASGTFCGGACVDTTSDTNNCGGCADAGGEVCPPAEVCIDAGCACQSASTPTFCPDSGSCVDTTSDSNNCGGCGLACTLVYGSGSTCQASVCACSGTAVVCDLACVDLQSDLNNCGTCGAVCAGGAAPPQCQGGRCLITLVAGLASPLGMAVAQGNVYWANYLTQGSIDVVSVDGGDVVTLAPDLFYPNELAADDTSVYWTDQYNEYLMKMPLDGGTPITLATPVAPRGLVVSSTGIYMWGTDGVSVVGLDGGTPVALANVEGVAVGLAVNGTTAYCALQPVISEVIAAPLDGGAAVQLYYNEGPELSGGIAIDSANVYWGLASGGGISSEPLDGGPTTTFAQGNTPLPLVYDSGHLYWISDDSVMRVDVDGGNLITLATGQDFEFPSLAVDGTSVYWTSNNETDTDGGAIMKLTPK